ncbi:MAG: carbon monoxide dehydrogenase [Deltaproteobacteria bacterium RBG_16_54_18]|nr:MAG: carbon monoxide dehydrogenase [Deltaproteobacteria bacterium RBG_16_54_18]
MTVQKNILKVGKAIHRIDARSKVRGAEKYASDYYGQNLVWAGVKRAGIPHARIKNIIIEKTKNLTGVISVLTYRDIHGSNRQGVIRRDQPVLADDKVRHCGDAVALVLAEDQAVLKEALDLIAIDYEPLPGIFSIGKALEQGAPLIHEEHPGGNVLLKGDLKTGRGEAALEECDVVVEGYFTVPYQEHAYLETEGGWALLTEDGHLEITASTQTPFRDLAEVAEALGIERESIRIRAPYCGGAFGGKDGITVQSLLALAALHCQGRPVRMVWDREESFIAGVKRHPGSLHYRLGAKADGTLYALSAEVYYDTGPYDHLGGAILALGLEHAGGPYRIPHASIRGWSVYTNNPVAGAFRGFGVPQVAAAMEQTMDMLAAKLDLSPLEMRRRNAVHRGDKTPLGVTLISSTGLAECLDAVAEHALWKEKERWKASAGSSKKRGVGIACVMHGMGYGPIVPDYANAKIELTKKGAFRIFCGVVDMGQGNASTYLQIAGDILNQDMDHLELVLPDTEKTLPSGSASASRTTYTFGNALIGAAEALKKRILQRSAETCASDPNDGLTMVLRPGSVFHPPTGKEIPLSQIVRMLDESERISVFEFRAPVTQERPTEDENLRLHGIPHRIFSYGVHLAYVEVDELTGKVEAQRYLAISDCGRIINPQVFEQQIQGGIAQGIGYALCEDLVVARGKIQTPNLSTYVIPTAMDIPEMESIAIEKQEETGPFGLKGAGEIAIDGPLPAIANAVADACGVRIFHAPLAAGRVLTALEAKRGGKEVKA